MKDALFFLLCDIVFTILIVVDICKGTADLHSTHTKVYLGMLCLMYIASLVAFGRYWLFLHTKKRLAKKWGTWKTK